MELEKATIQPIIPEGEPIEVLFNPTQYRLSRSNRFAEINVPGLPAPLLQFSQGNAQTLSMQLTFDTVTYYQSDDVRLYTSQVTDLLAIDNDLHAPPVCQFSWGQLNFVCVLERAEQSYTMFLPSGVPVRATIDVTFKQYVEAEKQISQNKSANFTRQYIVRRGDTLTRIAHDKYGSGSLWRPIAEANDIDAPLSIQPGDVLVIPAIE